MKMAPTFLFVVLAALVHFSSAVGNKPSFRQYRRVNTRTHNGRQTPLPFNCVKSGFFADPKDCTRFYRCVDYYGTETQFTLFEFMCAEGTIFDESLSVCNHPSWVNPTPPCWATTPGLNSTTGSGGSGPVTSSPPASSSEAAATTVTATGSEASTSSPVTELTPSAPTVPPTELPTQPNGSISETTTSAIATESTSSTTNGPTPSGETTAPIVTESMSSTTNEPTPSGETTAPIVTDPSASPLMETTTSAASTSVEGTGENLVTATAAPSVQPTEPSTSVEVSPTPAPESTSTSASEVPPTEPVSTTTLAPVTEPVSTSSQTESTTTLAPMTSASPIVQPPTTVAPFTLTCNDEKFHRHPLRCDLYYKCVWTDLSFSVDLRACPAGLHYDEDSGTCRTPGRTNACTFATLPPSGVATTEPLTTLAVTESATTTTTTTETPSTSAEPPMTVTESTTTTTTEIPSTSAEPTTAPPVAETTPTTAPVVPTQYTLAPGSLYDCKRPGHYPYQLDCIRFYRCFEVQPTVLKGLLYRCPPDYGYSTVTERCVRQNTLPACDRNGIRLPMDFPVPIIKLEDTTMVRLEDFDSFFSNPNYFYNPRRKFKKHFTY